ncbi:HAD family phosphatase [Rhodobacterales bacterium]|nr:HAD family phosphatase [Rhodobacterales bacterium]
MTEIRFVIFDMDEVLYDYDHGERLRLLAELTGRPAAEIDEAVWGGPHESRAEAGHPDTAEGYLRQFGDLLGYPIDFDTWALVRKRMMRPRHEVLDLVRGIRSGTDLALLTNNGMMLKAALPVCAPEMLEIFGKCAHVSAEFGARKPDPEIYRRICARYGHAPAETAFVDDKAENVEGALEAGLSGHLYSGPEGLRAYLQSLHLI